MPQSLKAKPVKKEKPLRPLQIDRLRDSYVSMIATARRIEGTSNAFLDKAHSLLTTHWAPATWASRATILKSVDWLLRMGVNHAAPADRKDAQPAAQR